MDARTFDSEQLGRDLVAGAVAGTVATLAMSAVMLGAQRLGLLGEQPPRKLADALFEDVAGVEVGEQGRRIGTAVIHLGIGAAAAAAHQAGRRLAGHPRPAVLWGGGFGAGFWAVNYGALMPALGLMPPPHRDRPMRAPVMLASNVLWGALSASIGDRLVGRLRAARPNEPANERSDLAQPPRPATGGRARVRA